MNLRCTLLTLFVILKTSIAFRSKVTYPVQRVTEEQISSPKQWLRRQKAQDLREEAPKRFLVDNRQLNAGTDGVAYREHPSLLREER